AVDPGPGPRKGTHLLPPARGCPRYHRIPTLQSTPRTIMKRHGSNPRPMTALSPGRLGNALRGALLGLALAATPAIALAGPTLHLEASVRSELPNDEMVVQLAVERSGPAAEKLNEEVLQAL